MDNNRSKKPNIRNRMHGQIFANSALGPHLSPVGSLTNLLTDLSSTGFLHQRNKSNVAKSFASDKNKDIPLILAREVANKK